MNILSVMIGNISASPLSGEPVMPILLLITNEKISLIPEPIWNLFPSVIHTVIKLTAASWNPRCYSTLSLHLHLIDVVPQITAKSLTEKIYYHHNM